MARFFDKLTPAKVEDSDTAYYLDDVLALLTAPRRKLFDGWVEGKQLEVMNDRGIIYRSQLDEFFEGVTN